MWAWTMSKRSRAISTTREATRWVSRLLWRVIARWRMPAAASIASAAGSERRVEQTVTAKRVGRQVRGQPEREALGAARVDEVVDEDEEAQARHGRRQASARRRSMSATLSRAGPRAKTSHSCL